MNGIGVVSIEDTARSPGSVELSTSFNYVVFFITSFHLFLLIRRDYSKYWQRVDQVGFAFSVHGESQKRVYSLVLNAGSVPDIKFKFR